MDLVQTFNFMMTQVFSKAKLTSESEEFFGFFQPLEGLLIKIFCQIIYAQFIFFSFNFPRLIYT